MTLPLSLERLRSFFPVAQNLVYLNHAGVAPVSTRVVEALARFARAASERGAYGYDDDYDAEVERVRGRAAQLIGAAADEIAFVKNTTEGLGIVAAGLDWRRGDRVLSCDLEYPSNVYAWKSLASQGVETVLLRGRDGRLLVEDVEEALRDPSVRLLAVSSVQFGSGFRSDLFEIGRLCRDRGVLFCVDAIQSLGCLPLDVAACGIDFLAADGHKWICSVEGCGVLYVARRVLERVKPRILGWRSMTHDDDFDRYDIDLKSNAGRFEEGTPNVPGIFALGAAIDLLLEIGVQEIGERVLALTDRLVSGLERRGAVLRTPRGPGESSGIVSFRWPREEPQATAERLRAERIFVVARRGGVRASPHVYNREDEIDALVDAL